MFNQHHQCPKQYKKLDSGLDVRPTVMVGEPNKKQKNSVKNPVGLSLRPNKLLVRSKTITNHFFAVN